MPPFSKDKRILIVEDDADLRELYRSTLRAAGYFAVAVEDGVDALRYLEMDRADAVVLDLQLPRLGGRDVHRELKAQPQTRHIPIIVVSGTDVSDLRRSEFSCVLRKPITIDRLLAAIEKCV